MKSQYISTFLLATESNQISQKVIQDCSVYVNPFSSLTNFFSQSGEMSHNN